MEVINFTSKRVKEIMKNESSISDQIIENNTGQKKNMFYGTHSEQCSYLAPALLVAVKADYSTYIIIF